MLRGGGGRSFVCARVVCSVFLEHEGGRDRADAQREAQDEARRAEAGGSRRRLPRR